MLQKHENPQTLARRESLLPEYPVTAWEPFTIMNRMRETMDHMFNDLFGGITARTEPEMRLHWSPPVDMYVRGEDLIVECAMPGLKKNEVDIQVTGENLTISGEYKRTEEKKKEGVFRTEIASGKFFRKIVLPYHVKVDKIKAVMDNGLLKVTMPLLEPALHKATTIKID